MACISLIQDGREVTKFRRVRKGMFVEGKMGYEKPKVGEGI